MTEQAFLTLHPYHLSREKAREVVRVTLARAMPQVPKAIDWKDGACDLARGDKTRRLTFAEMEREARLTGVVGTLQRLLDQQDGIFGGTYDTATPNFQITVTTEYAGWKTTAQGPCRIGVAEVDLMEDILHYREEACRSSADHSFRGLARHYRAYLTACVSLVDAFINRHILLATHDKFESPAFARLKESRGTEERIECWLETCTEKRMTALVNRKEWCHFQSLRRERNALLHAVDPFSVYRVKEIAKYLNYVQTGIGGLLKLLRDFHGRPTLLLIERLRTAPEVQYHALRLKAENAECAAN